MNILWISGFYHDSAAVLVRDGEIIEAAQEERFTQKNKRRGTLFLPVLREYDR
ncbi:MAG: carbamoyltransferase N-terminal domain-containing protein [Sedimentisphaerales bacterium]